MSIRMDPNRIHDIMSGKDASPGARMLRAAASVAEPFFAGAVLLRDRAYRGGWLRSVDLPAPTISVGNLTTGGTGKTPVVRWLAQRLRESDRRPAVLMRGYHADAAGVSDEQQLLESVLSSGAVPIPVIANPNRVAGARLAMQRAPGTDVFVLDDGFQHRRAGRDFDLVLVSATDPFGFGHLLPRGMLREPVGALWRADAVLVTRAADADATSLNELEQTVRSAQPAIPIFRCDHVHQHVRDTSTNQRQPLASVAAGRVFGFCGIGNPQSFENQIRHHDWDVAGFRAFADHHRYSVADLDELNTAARAADADRLVTTEKDWVKLARLGPPRSPALPIGVVEMEIRFILSDEQRLFERILSAVERADKKGRTEEG